MRTNLLTTLLDTARRNVGRGASDVAIYEIGLVTRPVAGAPAAPRLPGGVRPSDEDLAALAAAVPPQPRRVAGVLAGARERGRLVGPGSPRPTTPTRSPPPRLVAATVGVDVHVRGRPRPRAVAPRARCAGSSWPTAPSSGTPASCTRRCSPRLDLPARSVAFEVDLDVLLAAAPDEPLQAAPVSTFPVGKEDLALVVDADVPAGDVLAAVRDGAGELLEELHLFDVFTGRRSARARSRSRSRCGCGVTARSPRRTPPPCARPPWRRPGAGSGRCCAA